MKNLLKTLCFAAAAAVSFFFTAAAEEAIVIKPVQGADAGKSADALFQSGNPAVMQLTKLTPREITAVKRLPDADRMELAKAQSAEDEYHYTLDSAAEQAQKEEEKAKLGGQRSGASDTDGSALDFGDCRFFTLVNTSGITICFEQSNKQPSRYELILTPSESGRYGTQGVHLMFDSSNTGAKSLAWQNRETNLGRVVTNTPTVDGRQITRLFLSWNDFFNLTGDIILPVDRSMLWSIGIYRWADGEGSSVRGIPHDANANVYLMIPSFTEKQVLNVKSGIINGAVNGYYAVDHKTNISAVNAYCNMVIGDYTSLPFWKERFGVIQRLGYPWNFSELYLAMQGRDFPDELPSGTDKENKVAGEYDGRLNEYREDINEYANTVRDWAKYAIFCDSVLTREYDIYGNWANYSMPLLRLIAIMNRTHSEKFLQEE